MTQVDSGFIIGIDGGGTTCRVAIDAADGRVLGRASGPAANPMTSMETALASILTTLDAARRAAGLSAAEISTARAHLGLAGVINDTIAHQISAALPISRINVTDDRPTNMAGALGLRDGYLAALGPGSFLGRQQGARQRFIGGWGFWLDDRCSGAWLGRARLTRGLEWRDGLHAASDLLRATFHKFNDDTGAIVAFGRRGAPDAFAGLAPSVLESAKAGDPAAEALLKQGLDYVQRALEALGFQPGDPLCLIGGIGARIGAYLAPKYRANLIAPQGTALDGALYLARQMAQSGQGGAT